MNLRAPHPGPSRRDWAMLVTSGVFVAMGLLLLTHKPRVAIVTLALFGGCFALAARHVLEKRRFSQYRPTRVEIAGGVPLRPSRGRALLLGVSVLFIGSIALLFADDAPWHVRACFWLMVLAGGVLSVLVAAGKAPAGFVQLDPLGISFGERGYALFVPWNAIETVAMGEVSHNPALFLRLSRPQDVRAVPAEAAPRVARLIHTNLTWFGAHVAFITSLYGLDLPLVAQAFERYVRDPEARAELGRRLPAGDVVR